MKKHRRKKVTHTEVVLLELICPICQEPFKQVYGFETHCKDCYYAHVKPKKRKKRKGGRSRTLSRKGSSAYTVFY